MDNLSNTVRLLDIFSDHYITCEQCKMAFAEMRDTDYCNTGMPLFKAWQDEPAFGRCIHCKAPVPIPGYDTCSTYCWILAKNAILAKRTRNSLQTSCFTGESTERNGDGSESD